MAQNYMRAHARRFGMTDLEENVVHFPVPDVLPGFSFFDLEPSMGGADGAAKTPSNGRPTTTKRF
jgi:hypothetical protein